MAIEALKPSLQLAQQVERPSTVKQSQRVVTDSSSIQRTEYTPAIDASLKSQLQIDEDFARQLQIQEFQKASLTFSTKALEQQFEISKNAQSVSNKYVEIESRDSLRSLDLAKTSIPAQAVRRTAISDLTPLRHRALPILPKRNSVQFTAPLVLRATSEEAINSRALDKPRSRSYSSEYAPLVKTDRSVEIVNHANVHFNPIIRGKEVQAKGDGSCLYHSIGAALRDLDANFNDSTQTMRENVSHYIQNLSLDFFDGSTVKEQLSNRQKIAQEQSSSRNAWGNEFALNALSNLYSVNIKLSVDSL